MKSSKNVALAVLTLAVLGVATLAWKQHVELVALRVSALNNEERATLQKRIWAAENHARQLDAKLAANRRGDAGDATADDNSQPGQNQRGKRGGPGGGALRGGVDTMMAFLDQPDIQKLMTLQQKSQLDGRYAALFKSLSLSPEQLDKFKSLLVEKQNAMQDVLIAARAQGINPFRDDPEGLRKMVADTQAEVDNSIKATFGDDAFAKYQSYQETQAQRSVVSQLQQSLSYTNAPLTDAQAEALVQILAQNAPKSAGGSRPAGTEPNVTVAVGAPGGGGAGMFFNVASTGGFAPGGLVSAPITNEAIAAAQGLLSAPQLQGLQQLQQQQQTQQQLQQSIRQDMESQRGGGNASPRNPPASGG